MIRTSLRTGSLLCLAVWALAWVVFALMHFSPLDYRNIPFVGTLTLTLLAVALLAPVAAAAMAAAAVYRQRQAMGNWLTLMGALGILFGQILLWIGSAWM